jgi:hypothetical protein
LLSEEGVSEQCSCKTSIVLKKNSSAAILNNRKMVYGTDKLSVYQKAMAEMFIVKEFCCCLGSLKCGTIFIGIIYTVMYQISSCLYKMVVTA